jgi:hypothetical protein
MTRVHKGRANAKVNPGDDESPRLAICFSEDTKMVLQRILSNAIACIDKEMLHDATGLGVLAAHLQAIAEAAHDCVDHSPFHEGLEGDAIDPELCKQLQISPTNWADVWSCLPEHLQTS